MKTRYEIGIQAEKEAKKFLEAKHIEIVENRFKTPYGEIDIIAKDKETIVFVEVKFRKTNVLECISERQKERIKNASLYYLSMLTYSFDTIRFDAILIHPSKTHPFFKMHHIKDAW